MNKRLNSLKSEIGINSPDFKDDTKSIVKKVNSALDANPEERDIYMRQKFFKAAFAAIMVMVMGTSAVFAATNINSDFLRAFFTGDTSYLDEFVQTPRQSVTDENFVLTLEQTLVTTQQALVIFSVEALTAEARATLNATNERGFDAFIGMDTITFGPVNSDARESGLIFGGWGIRSLEARRTDAKRYFAITVTDMVNENREDFFIRLNKMADSPKIVISMETNIEPQEFVLTCSSGDEAVLHFTPLGITLERTISTNGNMFLNMIDGLFFRRACGEINTFSQLLLKSGVWIADSTQEESAYLRHEMSALFREIMSISEFSGIILDGVEHDINDTSITKPFVPNPTIQPFELQPYYRGHLWVPLEELCERIGADIRWGEEPISAIVEYRGSTFVIAVGSTIIVRNGEVIDFYNEFDCDATFVSQDGRLIVSSRLLDLMGLGISSINTDANGEFLPVSEWTWIIIP